MKEWNLLIITGWFPSKGTSFSSPFVYSQVLELSKHFRNVHVISITPYIPKVFRKKIILERLGMKNRWHQDIYSEHYAEDYVMGNISVHYVRYAIPPKSIFRALFQRRTVKKIKKLIDSKHIDFSIMHAHFLWPSGYIAASLKNYYRGPVVVTGHGSDVYVLPFKSSSWRRRIEHTLNGADAIITVGKKNMEIMVSKLGVPREKVHVIPNGYDSEIFRPLDKKSARKALNIPDDKKVILTVGNLLPVKGHKYLIEAINRVKSDRNDILCIIVGSGPLEEELKKQIHSLGLEGEIKMVGGRPYDEIPLWMNACDVFVLPSMRESFGVVQIEAMACGKPVVATINGGSEEIISDERVGLLVTAGDSEELAEGIENGLDTEWDGEYIRKFAEKYSWANVIGEIINTYKKL